jgi:hypothetical protein
LIKALEFGLMARIISVELAPVARVFAITYAFFGLVAFIVYVFSSDRVFVLPIGVVMGIFHLNLNLQLARSTYPLSNAFLCAASICSYGLTGWITGTAVTLCFNAVAKKTGGIDASFVSTVNDESAANPA